MEEFKVFSMNYLDYKGEVSCTRYGLKSVETHRVLKFPNNDWIMFEDKESADKVCELINTKAI